MTIGPDDAFGALDAAQRAATGDMDPEAFRAAAHAVVELMADYLAGIEGHPVLPDVQPGDVRAQLPALPPEAPEPLATILADYRSVIEPNITHWQHPGFFAYFPSSASGPGILGEMLTAAIVSNAMLWRTSPAATELEQVTVDWLRQGLGLPATFGGLFTDTASTSSLIGLAAARERASRAAGDGAAANGAAANGAAADGLAGAAAHRIYISEQAHSSIDKAAMILGIGRAGVRHITADADYAMDVTALRAAIAEDRAAGHRPAAIVATVGTTSSTAVDPVAAIADVAQAEGLWLHVDAAYAGPTALLPERRAPFEGWERADSIVVNPHKWLFTPLDCSLFLTRDLATVHAAFSLKPEYLRTLDRDQQVMDLNEFQPQLGRRFRALKMWFLLRYFGLEGLRSRLRDHLELARRFAGWVDAEPDAERLAPVPFSTICFRWRPATLSGRGSEPEIAALLDRLNEQLIRRVNATGEVFLSHTRLRDRFTIRLSIGNVRSEERHVVRAWELLRREGRALAAET